MSLHQHFLLIVLLGLAPAGLFAQAMDTEIFIVEYTLEEGDSMKIGEYFNATERKGYDNQPYFPKGANGFLYTSIREAGTADIYFRNLASGDEENLTQTDSTSEYSPQISHLKNALSVVRVEEDQKTQRMWRFDSRKDSILSSMLLEDVQPVGYYAWGDERSLVMFVLGEPNTLQLAYTDDTIRHLITGNVGRCIQKIPGENAVSFVHKISADRWLLKSLDLESLDISTIIECPRGSEDYAWTRDRKLLIGDKGKLLRCAPDDRRAWHTVHDFAGTDLENFYRIACDPEGNRIALVSYVGEKP